MGVPDSFDVVVFDSAALAAAIVILGFLALLALGLRRRIITRNAGTFECCVRTAGKTRFALGMARYGGDRLDVFRWFSLSFRPHAVFERSLIVETGRRKPVGREVMLLGSGDVLVLEFSYAGRPAALALDESALTGFLAWIEAAPPRAFGG